MCAALFVAHLYVFFPITTDLTAWYATEFAIALVICVALGVYAACQQDMSKSHFREPIYRFAFLNSR